MRKDEFHSPCSREREREREREGEREREREREDSIKPRNESKGGLLQPIVIRLELYRIVCVMYFVTENEEENVCPRGWDG